MKSKMNKLILLCLKVVFCLYSDILCINSEYKNKSLDDLNKYFNSKKKDFFTENTKNFINLFIEPLISEINIKEQIKSLFDFLNTEDLNYILLKEKINNNTANIQDNEFFNIINNFLVRNNILNVLGIKLNKLEKNLEEVIGEENILVIKRFIQNKEKILTINIDNKNYIKSDLLFYIQYKSIFENLEGKKCLDEFKSNFIEIDSSFDSKNKIEKDSIILFSKYEYYNDAIKYTNIDDCKKILLEKNSLKGNILEISNNDIKSEKYIFYFVEKYFNEKGINLNKNQLQKYKEYFDKRIGNYQKFSFNNSIKSENIEYIIKEIILSNEFINIDDNNKEKMDEEFKEKINKIMNSFLINSLSINNNLDKIESAIKKFSEYGKYNLNDIDTLKKYFNYCKINNKRDILGFLNKYFKEKKDKDSEVEKLFKAYYLKEAEKELKNIYEIMANKNSSSFEEFMKIINKAEPCSFLIKSDLILREDSEVFCKILKNYIILKLNINNILENKDIYNDERLNKENSLLNNENNRNKVKGLTIINNALPFGTIENESGTNPLKKIIRGYPSIMKNFITIIFSDCGKDEFTANVITNDSITSLPNFFYINLLRKTSESIKYIIKNKNYKNIPESKLQYIIENHALGCKNIKEINSKLEIINKNKESNLFNDYSKNKKNYIKIEEIRDYEFFKNLCNRKIEDDGFNFYGNEKELRALHETILSGLNQKQDFESNRGDGRLLIGTPGVGKTEFLRILEQLSLRMENVEVIVLKPSDLAKPFVGQLEDTLRSILDRAMDFKSKGKAVFVFIDEIHEYVKKSTENNHDHTKKTVKDILLNYFGGKNSNGVILIGATNDHNKHMIDPAFMSRMQTININALKSKEQINKMIRNYLGEEFENNYFLISYFYGNNTSDNINKLTKIKKFIEEQNIDKKQFNNSIKSQLALNEKVKDIFYGASDVSRDVDENSVEIAAYQYLLCEIMGKDNNLGISRNYRDKYNDLFMGIEKITIEMLENKTAEEIIYFAVLNYLPIYINSESTFKGKGISTDSIYNENLETIQEYLFNRKIIRKEGNLNEKNFHFNIKNNGNEISITKRGWYKRFFVDHFSKQIPSIIISAINIMIGAPNKKWKNLLKAAPGIIKIFENIAEEEKKNNIILSEKETKKKSFEGLLGELFCKNFFAKEEIKNKVKVIKKFYYETGIYCDLDSKYLNLLLRFHENKLNDYFINAINDSNKKNIYDFIKDIYIKKNEKFKNENKQYEVEECLCPDKESSVYKKTKYSIKQLKEKIKKIKSHVFIQKDLETLNKCKKVVKKYKKNKKKLEESMNGLSLFIGNLTNIYEKDLLISKSIGDKESCIEVISLLAQIDISREKRNLYHCIELTEKLFDLKNIEIIKNKKFKEHFMDIHIKNEKLNNLIDYINNGVITLEKLNQIKGCRFEHKINNDGNSIGAENDRDFQNYYLFGNSEDRKKNNVNDDNINKFIHLEKKTIKLFKNECEKNGSNKLYSLENDILKKEKKELTEKDYYEFIFKNIKNIQFNKHLSPILEILNKKFEGCNYIINSINDLNDLYDLITDNEDMNQKCKNSGQSENKIKINNKNSFENEMKKFKETQNENKLFNNFRIKNFQGKDSFNRKFEEKDAKTQEHKVGYTSYSPYKQLIPLKKITISGQSSLNIFSFDDLLKKINNHNEEKKVEIYFENQEDDETDIQKKKILKEEKLNNIGKSLFFEDASILKELPEVPSKFVFNTALNNSKQNEFTFEAFNKNNDKLLSCKNSSSHKDLFMKKNCNIFIPTAAA